MITETVSAGWGLEIRDMQYVPEGGGAYHWVASVDSERRWFVTCDDLDVKPWLGSDRESVFDGLRAAYRTAMNLRASGSTFVVAPRASASGEPAERVDDRHSVSVFDHVEGEPGRWGRPLAPVTLADLVTILARLHRSPPAACSAAVRGLEVPGRAAFEDALDSLDRDWRGGPLSEQARHELSSHVHLVREWLTTLDRFAAGSAGSTATPVITHGEPHPGNLISTTSGPVLVDWDTVALARPERDLWMFGTRPELVDTYEDLTGIGLDHEAMTAYRLLWALADLASFTVRLRSEHGDDIDAARSLVAMRLIFDGSEPTPYERLPHRYARRVIASSVATGRAACRDRR